ncbi:MAG TPA: SufE family protein [Flavobacteriales bacterium]|nr:SufE family protein [Flavobacteriales bacterium]
MATINERQDEIIEDFSLFDDWMGKYEHLIEFGKSLPLLNKEHKIEENEVKGCQSKVWLHTECKDGKIYFTADSNAIITKGIIGLLVHILSGQKPEEIINNELYFIDKIGLKEHLTPLRSNGMVSMVKQMKMYALGYKIKAS